MLCARKMRIHLADSPHAKHTYCGRIVGDGTQTTRDYFVSTCERCIEALRQTYVTDVCYLDHILSKLQKAREDPA